MKRFIEWLGSTWCKVAHEGTMWPVKGYYRCPVCLRAHPVPWEHAQRSTQELAGGGAAHQALALPRR